MELSLEQTQKSVRTRAAESLEELRRSFESGGSGDPGRTSTSGYTQHLHHSHLLRSEEAGSSGTCTLRERRNSWSEGHYHNDLTYRAAADKLSQMIEQRETRTGGSDRHGIQFAPPMTSHFLGNASLPPKGRMSGSLPHIPSQDELLNVVQNQGAYMQMLEAENKYSREGFQRVHSTGNMIQVDGRVDTMSKFEIELTRINAMHTAKVRRLEAQLSQAKEEIQRLEQEVETIRSQLRSKESNVWQDVAMLNHQTGSVFDPGASGPITFSQVTYDRLTKERDDLLSSVGQLRAKLERMKQREQELYEQLANSIETVEQAKLEETQAFVQARQLSEELNNMRARFDEAMMDQQRRLEDERKAVTKEMARDIEAAKAGSRDAEEEAAKMGNKAEKVERRLKECEGKLEDARLQIRAYETDYSKTRDDLQAALTRSTLHRDQAVSELNRMRQHLDSEQHDRAQERQIFKSEVADLRTRLGKTEQSLMQANEDRIKLTNENQALQREVSFSRMQRDSIERTRNQEVSEVRAAGQRREAELSGLLAEGDARFEASAREAQEMLDRHGQLVGKLREECRYGVQQLEQISSRHREESERLRWELEQVQTRAERSGSRSKELEAQVVEHARTHEKMRSRLKQMEERSQQQGQQMTNLLAKQNALFQDRQLLAKEVEFLRAQITIPENMADQDKIVSGGSKLVDEILNKVRCEAES